MIYRCVKCQECRRAGDDFGGVDADRLTFERDGDGEDDHGQNGQLYDNCVCWGNQLIGQTEKERERVRPKLP